MAKQEASNGLSPAVGRAVGIMECLARTPNVPQGPTELAGKLGLPKSSVSNICQTLTDTGMLRKTERGYQLGLKIIALSRSYLESIDVVQAFHAALGQSRLLASETVQLAVLGQDLDVVYLSNRLGDQPVKLSSDIGRALPANCTAIGKVLLAQLSDDAIRSRIDAHGGLPSLTKHSITDLDLLAAEIEKVRQEGYATDNEETLIGTFCIAAPVLRPHDSNGHVAISVTRIKASLEPSVIDTLSREIQLLASQLSIS